MFSVKDFVDQGLICDQTAQIYSDCHKDCYGFRPGDYDVKQFESLDAFTANFNRMSEEIGRQEDERIETQAANFEQFKVRVAETMDLCNTDRDGALRIIADAEDRLEDLPVYGWESLEYDLNLGFGSIKGWLNAEVDS